jgi:ATP-binding cassette subfamily B multidrug efflux pump
LLSGRSSLLQLVQAAGNLLLPTANASIIDDGIVAGNQPAVISRLGVDDGADRRPAGRGRPGSRVPRCRRRHEDRPPPAAKAFARSRPCRPRRSGRSARPACHQATNDVQQIQTFAVLVFTMLAAAPVMGIGGIILAVQQNAALSSS